jgi:uncharacterized protein (DUF983 family)
MIAKSARTCPQCGKSFTNAAGLVLAVLVALAVGWLLMARYCAMTVQADRELDEVNEKLMEGR